MSKVAGEFVWYELMTSDTAGAEAFYSEVVGWKTQSMPGPSEMPYTMWAVGETPVGGLMTLPEEAKAAGAPPHWLAYVGTENIEASVAQVKELGGTVHVPPTEIPKMGTFSVIADPQGAVIALWAAQSKSGDHGAKGSGRITWHELVTTDLDAGFAFYESLFGWQKTEAMEMGEMGTYQMYGNGDGSLGGMMKKGPEMQMPPAWIYYITVDNIEDALARVTSHGGQIIYGPQVVPGGDSVAQCIDPQGAVFALHSNKSE